MRREDVANVFRQDSFSDSDLFASIQVISKYVLEHGATDPVALDAIIRLRDLIQIPRGNAAVRDAVFSLCREAGLFPYVAEEEVTWRDKVAYEFFRGPQDLDYVFHREQWEAFQYLVNGKSVLLSAPTSFGKSVLIHAYIAARKPHCVVIVVPTIALLDQFRRRLTEYFSDKYFVITRNDQTAPLEENRIFVLTQERLLDRDDIQHIDLLAIDEYYKLDQGREKQGEGSRATLLNIALRRYMTSADQVFLLGPSVAGTNMRNELRSRLVELRSEFSTVAVNVHDETDSDDPYKRIASLLKEHGTDKSLIFSKSPPAARRLMQHLADKAPLQETSSIRGFADWLGENYHPEWPLVTALRAGYGLHHGSIPRSVAQALVRVFNEGDLQALICTSTLIEGVNTSAKNVFVFDKKISNTNYDYFDFRNIAGRSGRMGYHFVGRIFLFHEPPPNVGLQLDIPALGDDESLPDSVLINLPDDSISRELRIKKQEILDRSSLPEDLVKRFAPYGLQNLDGASQTVQKLLGSRQSSLLWRGYVGYKELLAVFSVAWGHLRFNKGRLTAKEAAFHANRLRVSRTLRAYFDGLVANKDYSERIESIEKGFRALVSFDYAVPKVLIDMEALVQYHCTQMGIEGPNYSFMAQSLDNLFTHHWVKALDEYGVPFPLGKRLASLVSGLDSLDEAISAVRQHAQSSQTDLPQLERQLIRDALGT
jgi:hypothetical protein